MFQCANAPAPGWPYVSWRRTPTGRYAPPSAGRPTSTGRMRAGRSSAKASSRQRCQASRLESWEIRTRPTPTRSSTISPRACSRSPPATKRSVRWHVPSAETMTTRQFVETVFDQTGHRCRLRGGADGRDQRARSLRPAVARCQRGPLPVGAAVDRGPQQVRPGLRSHPDAAQGRDRPDLDVVSRAPGFQMRPAGPRAEGGGDESRGMRRTRAPSLGATARPASSRCSPPWQPSLGNQGWWCRWR
jgi:hypothetical protein